MSQVKSKASRTYTRHSADYKKEALRLAELHGVSKAAFDYCHGFLLPSKFA
jgi:hypothetical protein